MTAHPYSHLVRYKQWASRGLYEVVAANIHRLDALEASIVVRILDHIQITDRIFQHHLQGVPHGFTAPRSSELPELGVLIEGSKAVDDWYASYVATLSSADFEQAIEFRYTNGTPARMTRGEMLLHVCLHGTYHRGNAGIVFQKNGIQPNDDRMTDFLEKVA